MHVHYYYYYYYYFCQHYVFTVSQDIKFYTLFRRIQVLRRIIYESH
jgi:hypothetical protein